MKSKNRIIASSSLFIVVILSIGLLVSGAKPTNKSPLDGWVLAEPGLYVSQFEETNNYYRTFLSEVRKQNEMIYLENLPDTSQWIKAFPGAAGLDVMMKVYYDHPKYDNYPVVNVSMVNIQAYCAWRTEYYNKAPKRVFKEVVFRLPTKEEWMRFASPFIGSPFPWAGNLPFSYKDDHNDNTITDWYANLKIKDYSTMGTQYIYDGGLYPLRVTSYAPNKIGLHNIIGNVAEITSDGVCKGGGWDNTPEESGVHLEQNYSLPHPCVGFRLVMQVIRE